MLGIRLAVATRRFDQPLKTALRTAAEMGVDGVQLDTRAEIRPQNVSETARREIHRNVNEYRLAVASVNYPNQRSLYDTDHLDARVAGIKAALRLTHDLKASALLVRPGRIPSDQESKDYRRLVEVLSDLASHGNHVGSTLTLTPGDDPPSAITQLVKSIVTGPIGINYDTAHWVMAGIDLSAAFREMHADIIHIQARDAVRGMDGVGLEVPLGQGSVDWAELLALTEEAGFRGWFTIDRTSSDDMLGDLTRSVQYIKRVAF